MSVVKPENGFFPITSVHRADLEEIGFDVVGVTDEQMLELADRMGDVYVESGAFWDHLKGIAEEMGIPRRSVSSFLGEVTDEVPDQWPKRRVI